MNAAVVYKKKRRPRQHSRPSTASSSSSKSGRELKGTLKQARSLKSQATQTGPSCSCCSDLGPVPSPRLEDGNSPLLELPAMAYSKIINYLPPKSCLALRRVCRTTQRWVSTTLMDSHEVKKWKGYMLTITGKGMSTFSTIVNMNLPITNFLLKNSQSGTAIYTSEGHQKFLKVYGPIATSFTVDRHFLFAAEAESFFQHFPVLWRLVICVASAFTQKSLINHDIPVNITSNLKQLVIHGVDRYKGKKGLKICQANIIKLIDSCESLTYLKPPSIYRSYIGAPFRIGCILTYYGRYTTFCHEWMQQLEISISAWARRATTRGNCLDLNAFNKYNCYKWSHPQFYTSYNNLLRQATEFGVWFHGIHAEVLTWIYLMRRNDEWPFRQIAASFGFMNNILSMVGTSAVLGYSFSPMIQLREINVSLDFSQCLFKTPYEMQVLDWRRLEKIYLTIVITAKSSLTEINMKQWVNTTELLFGRERKNVNSLSLMMKIDSKLLGEETVIQFLDHAIDWTEITSNFKCLTSLSICGWNISNKSFLELWAHLTKLEYLYIGSCKNLGDFGFIGKQKQWSGFCAFFQLSRLRTLVLKGLDEMPVTENLFTVVIKDMSLEELWIHGKVPQITNQAIKILHQGEFGRSVKKFPLHTWKSENITEEADMNQIKKWFPSGI